MLGLFLCLCDCAENKESHAAVIICNMYVYTILGLSLDYGISATLEGLECQVKIWNALLKVTVKRWQGIKWGLGFAGCFFGRATLGRVHWSQLCWLWVLAHYHHLVVAQPNCRASGLHCRKTASKAKNPRQGFYISKKFQRFINICIRHGIF